MEALVFVPAAGVVHSVHSTVHAHATFTQRAPGSQPIDGTGLLKLDQLNLNRV